MITYVIGFVLFLIFSPLIYDGVETVVFPDEDSAVAATALMVVFWPLTILLVLVAVLLRLGTLLVTVGRGTYKIFRHFFPKREKVVDIPPARVVP